MSKDAEMKDARESNEEKNDSANTELSKAELEKLALEGMCASVDSGDWPNSITICASVGSLRWIWIQLPEK
jgi:hypothetical protein